MSDEIPVEPNAVQFSEGGPPDPQVLAADILRHALAQLQRAAALCLELEMEGDVLIHPDDTPVHEGSLNFSTVFCSLRTLSEIRLSIEIER